MIRTVLAMVCILAVWSCKRKTQDPAPKGKLDSDKEVHLKNVRQLTFGGENAEAYFSFSNDRLVFQSTRDSLACDQIFTMDLEGKDVQLVSTGKGKTTCAYYLKGDKKIIFSSTHHVDEGCPPRPDYSQGYVWPLYNYDIFRADQDGSNLEQLTDSPGYDAEATLSPDGTQIVFTSLREGDINIYVMDVNGKNIRALTNRLGYEGGAFFSADGKKIVFRAQYPVTEEEKKSYSDLIARNLVRPNLLEIYMMDPDGSNIQQVTNLKAASFAPFFHPDGQRIIFSTNYGNAERNFDLYMIQVDGTNLERITFDPTFDGFPMFSKDGKKLVFASNRFGSKRGETNVFIADWID